jgi:hypothetical protein
MPQALVRYESPALLSSRRAIACEQYTRLQDPHSPAAAGGCATKTSSRSVFLHFLNFLYFLNFFSLLRQVAMHNFGSVSLFV